MRSTFLRALTATTALVSAITAAGAALADCQPDPAATGQTVTCTGTDADGFAAGAATNLTFNVLTGASVTTGAGNTVLLNSGNVVSNAGTILAPVVAANGILLNGGNNTVTNSGAVVVTGLLANGILAQTGDANTITNTGAITASGTVAAGINLATNTNTVTNGGTIEASGVAAFGITVSGGGTGNRIINNGTIVASGPGGATGVFFNFVNANALTNAGTITASGDNTTGVFVSNGSANTLTNSGAITASGAGATGVSFVNANGNTLTNSGTVTASGAGARGVVLDVGANTVTNSGTITASGTGATGVLFLTGTHTVTNSGTITASAANAIALSFINGAGSTVTNLGAVRALAAGSIAVSFDTGSTGSVFTNSGLIFADASVNAVATGFVTASGTGTLTNAGTIDGRMTATGINVVNSGLIQTTTGAVGQTHAVGAFTQSNAGTLALRVNAAAARDALGTAGTAALGGTLRAVVQNGLYNNVTLYPNVVTATAGVGGLFASVVSTSPFFTPSATYGANAVNLTLTRIGFGAVPGLTQNQQAIGAALEAGYSTALTGNAAAIYGALLGGTTVPYNGLSGEVGTGVQNPTFAMGDSFMTAIFGQAQRWRGLPGGSAGTQSASMRVQFASAQPSFELSRSYAQAAAPGAEPWPPRAGVGPHWAAWASGFGLGGGRDGDASVGSARIGYSMGGGALGADVQLNPNLLLGGAVGGAGSDFSLDGRSASGTSRAMFFSLYGSWTMGPLYVDAAATYGLASFSTNRIATQGTILERATGDFDGHQVGGRVEAGWRFLVQRYELTPFAGVTVQSLHQDAYSENATNFTSGAPGILGLNYQAQSTTSVRSTLGAQAATRFQLGERTSITPRIRAAWAHEFNDDRQVGASFISIPAASFTVNGARPARDAALVSAGIDVGIGRNVTVFAQFDSELAGSGNAYAGSGGLRVSW